MGERASHSGLVCAGLHSRSLIGSRVWYLSDIQADHVACIFRDPANTAAGMDTDCSLMGRYYR